MPNRIVREAILSSEKVASLGWPEEVFYRRLMSVVDDYGRTEANPQLLRARCYPLQTDTVRVADITRWIAACEKAGVILGYAVEGKQYLELSKFQQQQRTASKCPPPPAFDSKCSQEIANAHLGVVVSVVEVVDGASPAEPAPLPAILIPVNDGEAPIAQATVNEFTTLYPAVDVIGELRRMRAWAISNPTKRKTRSGLMRFVNTWLSKAQDSGRSSPPSAAASQPGGGRRRLG